MAATPVEAAAGVRRPGEKSNFSVTCSLFSKYLKENGGFGDLSLGMTAAAARSLAAAQDGGGRGNSEVLRTMNLLPGMEETPADVAVSDRSAAASAAAARSVNLFAQRAGFGSSAAAADKKPDVREQKPAAQMTIFYGGKVIVFDNFPAEKAKELMTMAGRGCPAVAVAVAVAPQNAKAEQKQQHRPVTPPPPTTQHNSTTFTSNSDAKPTLAAAGQSRPQRTPQPMASDLPIARKVSLHRFLEKRKDRISSKAPYQLHGSSSPETPTSAAPTLAKPEVETKQWLGLAPQVAQPAAVDVLRRR